MYSGALQLPLAITHVCNILLKGFNICCYIWFKFIFVHISSVLSDFLVLHIPMIYAQPDQTDRFHRGLL